VSHTTLEHTIALIVLPLQKRGNGKFKLLDSDGLCAVGESIENGDYYINKISPTNTKDLFPMGHGGVLPDNMYKPTPMSYKGSKGETSVVDKVLLTQNDENEEIIKVRKWE
jgi:DNA-directed RNA polymerase III subunit RPC2